MLVSQTAGAEPFCYPEGKYGKSELKYVNGLPVLTVAGTPEEIGSAIGVLAVQPGERMSRYPEDLLRQYHLQLLWRPLLSAGEKVVQRFPDDYHREMEAMARASGLDRDRFVMGNTLFDLKKVVACSALLVEPQRSATGGPLLGRNLDYPSLGYAQEYSLVTIYRPRGAKHAFASIGFPGLVGCLSGINDAGLSLAILEAVQIKVTRRWFESAGTPYALCYRRLLEECSTIDEAKSLLEGMRRMTITNLVIADRQSIAVFEVTPDQVLVRRPEQGTCICTNHFCTEELRPLVRLNLDRTYDRYRTLESMARLREKLGLGHLHRALHTVSDKDETMQTMIFEPARLRLHLAIGNCPASATELKVLDLAPFFGD
jgi:predicted choloylglycine hydrolase